LQAAGRHRIDTIKQSVHLSARAFHRTLRLGRTIADLAREANAAAVHVAEALHYRAGSKCSHACVCKH
jgi:magnesium chelatase family protein